MGRLKDNEDIINTINEYEPKQKILGKSLVNNTTVDTPGLIIEELLDEFLEASMQRITAD
jgi:hypothetical protein